ncbi:MAG: Gfo/Idh/MocA family protein [Acidimicrobiales bacterium]
MTVGSSTATAAVIGCGVIAHEHLRCLRANERAALVAVCDTSPVTARYAAERYGGAAFTDHRRMLDTTRPDVVHVLTPPHTHPALVRDALDHGADVVCEKPMALDLGETTALLDHADRLGRRLVESQNLRWNDPVMAIRDLVASGALGTVVGVEVAVHLDIASGGKFADPNLPSATLGLPGGGIGDFLPHLAYLALDQVGFCEPGPAWSRWWNRSGNPVVGFDQLEAGVELGDAVGLLRFDARVEPPGLSLTVRGTRGSADTDLYRAYLRVSSNRGTSPLGPIVDHMVNGARLVAAGPKLLR